jgi:hypothetical protein
MSNPTKTIEAPTNGRLTPEQMRQMLADEGQVRANACGLEIQAILTKHRCQIVAMPQFVPDVDGRFRVTVMTNVVATE